MASNHRVPFSRTGSTSPFGKLDGWLERTRIETEIKDRFEQRISEAFAKAGYAGRPAAEVVRDMVRVAALGPDMAARMYGQGVLVVFKTIGRMSDAQ